jgi:tape measure domain-containing protein
MGAEVESIGGVSVQVVGNYAPLLEDLAAAQAAAAKAGADIAAGLNKGAAAAGEFESKISELVSSGSTLAEALQKVQTGAAAMSSAVGSAGAAAASAATQLKLFDDAAMVPYSDAAGQLNMFADELEPLASEAKAAAGGVQQLGAETRGAAAEATAATSRFDAFKASVATMSSQLQDGARGLMVIGGALTAAVTVPLIGVAAAALKVSGELEQAKVAFTTLLGSAKAAQEHLDKLKEFAASTPFEFPDLVQASKRLQALGFAAKEIIPTLTAVGNAASALGSGQEGINRITLALGQMQMATRVTAQDMRQLTEAGIPAWQMLAQTLHTDVAGAMALVEKRAVDSATAVPALLAGMNAKFHGLMEEQAKTLLGTWSNFKDRVTFTLMDIGDTIAPIAKRVVDEALMPMLQWAKDAAHWFAQLPPVMQTAALGLAGVAAAVGPLLVTLGGMGFAISQISTAIPILTTLAAGLGSVVGVLLVGALAAAAAGFIDLDRAMFGVHEKQDAIGKKFLEYISKLVDGAKTAEEMAKAEERIKFALDNGAVSKEQATKLLGQLAEAQKKVVGTEWGKYADELGIAIRVLKNGTAEAMTTTEAFQVKMKAIRDEVTSTREALAVATQKYQEHKASAADVARAYDTWEAATQNLKNATQTLLPVVTNVHHATREFVDLTGRGFPDAAKQAANAVDAFQIKLGLQNEQIAIAQKYLDMTLERYRQYHDNAAEVTKALDALTKAQAAVTTELGKMPDGTEEFKKWEKAVVATSKQMWSLIPPLQAAPPLVRTLAIDLYDLGLRARDAAGEVTTKLLAAFEDLALKQKPTLEEAHLAWAKVQQDVNRLAKYDLPEALKVYGEYESLLKRVGASEGEVLAVRKEYLEVEIRIAEQTGADATKQIVGLQNVKLAQGLLYDQTHLLGDLYVNVTNDALKGFDDLGKSVADAIIDQTNLGDAFIATGKKIGKTILEDIVGTYFKALKDEILKSTGLLDGLTASLHKFFSATAKKAAGSAADDAGPLAASGAKDVVKAPGGIGGGGGGGTFGAVGAIADVGTLISSIVGNFQMAKIETTMNAVEHNTRFLEIIFQKFAEVDVWQRHREILEALGNIFTRLGEVGIGVLTAGQAVVTAVTESGTAVEQAIAQDTQAAADFRFKTGNSVADGILNALLGPTPKNSTAAAGIPHMAEGGPVIGDGVRYLHDGEYVVPRAEVPTMGAMSAPSPAVLSSSTTVNAGSNVFHVYEASNPRETARQIAEMLKRLSPRHAAYAQ